MRVVLRRAHRQAVEARYETAGYLVNVPTLPSVGVANVKGLRVPSGRLALDAVGRKTATDATFWAGDAVRLTRELGKSRVRHLGLAPSGRRGVRRADGANLVGLIPPVNHEVGLEWDKFPYGTA